LVDVQEIDMPRGAEILTVQMQNDTLMLWAKVASHTPHEPRMIVIIGTGNPIGGKLGRYIGTVQMTNRQLVWHVFEV